MSMYTYWSGLLAKRKAKTTAQVAKVAQARKRLARDRELVKIAEDKVEQYKPNPARLAIKWAQGQIGTIEHPANSNTGPKIDDWEKAVHMHAQPWCGAFMFAALSHAGVKGLTDRMRYTPFIVEDGKAGRNGLLKEVAWDDRKPGDLVLFDFDGGGVDHVGIFVSDSHTPGFINTVEGNTSSGPSGQQANGGGVFARARARSLVAHLIRPRYPA